MCHWRTGLVILLSGLLSLVLVGPYRANADEAKPDPDLKILATGMTWSPTSPEIGELVTLSITGHTGDIRAEWDFGENGCAGFPQIQVCEPSIFDCHDFAHKFASGGDKNVTVTVKDPTTGTVLGSTSRTITIQNVGSCGGTPTCTYSLNPASWPFPAEGGSLNVTVNTQSGCAWSASTINTWITLDAPASGNGGGSFSYSVAAYTGESRSGAISVQNQTHTVLQFGVGVLTPLKIVPTGTTTGSLTGRAVSVAYNTLVVGAPFTDQATGNMAGRAFVFQSTAGGGWTSYSELQLDPPYGGPDQRFGHSVEARGRTIVVGAPGTRHCGDPDYFGAAYIYQDTSPLGNWVTFTTTLICPSIAPSVDMEFGSDVSLWGRVLAVGSRQAEINGPESGAVFLFQDTSALGDWSSFNESVILASDGEPADFFGHSIDIDDRTLVVGAYGTNDTGSQSGSVYVFTDLSPPGDWSIVWETILLHPDPLPLARYGWDVVVHQRTIVASSPYDYISDHLSGSIQVFVDQSPSNDWTTYTQATIGPTGGNDWDEYGFSVDVENRTIIVGAPNAYSDFIQSGAVYMLEDESLAGDWSSYSEREIIVSDADFGDWIGYGVAYSSPLGAFGAPKDTNQNGPLAGSAYLTVEPVSPYSLFTDGFESGDTSAWSDVVP